MKLMFWVRRYLGIDALEMQAHQNKGLLASVHSRLGDIEHNTRVHNAAIGKVLAKLDPILGVDEQDPSRVAASKKLGDDIIKRLEDEAKVHKHYGYTPGDQS